MFGVEAGHSIESEDSNMHASNVMRRSFALIVAACIIWTNASRADDLPIDDLPNAAETIAPVKVGKFAAERLHVFTTADGLTDNETTAVAITSQGEVIAGTAQGTARWKEGRWEPCPTPSGRVLAMVSQGEALLIAVGGEVIQYDSSTDKVLPVAPLPPSFAAAKSASLAIAGGTIYLGGDVGLFALVEGKFAEASAAASVDRAKQFSLHGQRIEER